jgi:hypothetical protein
VKAIENGTLITGIRVKKKLFPISAMIVILCLTPMFAIMASAQSYELTLTIVSATADLRGKGNCYLARLGTIEADLPTKYSWDDHRSVGVVAWDAFYSYDFANPDNPPISLPLQLVEAIEVHIHIDGSFRRLVEGVPEDITMLIINGCTEEPTDGVQYCVYAGAYSENGYIGTVTRTGPNEWYVDVAFLSSDQGSPSFCGHEWIEGEPNEGFCIPLNDFRVTCIGKITG